MKASETNIVGIVLVQNEEFYIERVLWNIKDFCDRIIIADHRSIDRTAEIAQRFCDEHTGGEYHSISDPGLSHDLIKPYAGKKVWVFGVDGDELYEPSRLIPLRKQLMSGKYDQYWMLLGNALNCFELDHANGTAKGYLAPPCRSMTKLYNFSAISSWEGSCTERLHGGEVSFKSGYDTTLRCEIYKKTSWEKSVFRCLHLCFLPRSTIDKRISGRTEIRKNIADRMSANILTKIKSYLFRLLKIPDNSHLKLEKYMRGEVTKVRVCSFFPQQGTF